MKTLRIIYLSLILATPYGFSGAIYIDVNAKNRMNPYSTSYVTNDCGLGDPCRDTDGNTYQTSIDYAEFGLNRRTNYYFADKSPVPEKYRGDFAGYTSSNGYGSGRDHERFSLNLTL